MNTITSYLVVAILPLLIASLSYFQSIDSLVKISEENNLTNLELISNSVDSKFTELFAMVNQLSNDYQIADTSDCVNPIYDYNSILNVVDLRTFLSNYLYSHDFVDEIYLFNTRESFIIGSRNIYLQTDMWYSENSFMVNHLDFDNFMSCIIDASQNARHTYSTDIILNGLSRKAFFLVQKQYKGVSNNMILVVVNHESIEKYYFRDRQNHFFYAFDETGKEIISPDGFNTKIMCPVGGATKNSATINIDGVKYIQSYVRSDLNGYTYMSVIPFQKVLEKAILIRYLVFSMLLLAITVLFVLAVYMSKKNVKPIKTLASMFYSSEKPAISVSNELSFLERAIPELIGKNQNMTTKLEHQLSYVQNQVLNDLLSNRIIEEELIKQLVFSLQDGSNPLQFYIVACRLYIGISSNRSFNIRRISAIKYSAVDILRRTFKENVQIIDISLDTLALLIPNTIFHEPFDEWLEWNAKIVREALAEDAEADCVFSTDTISQPIMNIGESYFHALDAIEQGLINPKCNIIIYNGDKNYSAVHLFSMSMQTKIISLIKAGKSDELDQLLQDTYIKGLNHNLTNSQLVLFTKFLNGIFLDMLNRLPNPSSESEELLDECLPALFEKGSPFTSFNQIKKCLVQLAILFSYGKQTPNDQLKISMIRFVNTYFMDHDMCLSRFADEFKLSEPYVSVLFKEFTGKPFSRYLEELRIEHACNLLKQRIPVNQVALECGYNSTHTFRRAFKKVLQITPSEFSDS